MSVASKSQKSGYSGMSKEKLTEIRSREQLKGMLVEKFKKKYGAQNNKSELANIINFEVNKFVKNNRLTEENLKRLDDNILRQAELK